MSMNLNRTLSLEERRGCGRWWKAPILSGALLMMAGGAAASDELSPAELSTGILSAGTHDIYYRGEVLSQDGMTDLRGGFSLAGLELDFGATLTTMINDRVRYITRVAFDNAGAQVMSRSLDQSSSGPETVTPVGPGTGSSGISASDIRGQLNLAGLSDFAGVLLSDPDGGMTAALHQITRKAIVSSLSTTASGQTIDNRIDVSVQLNNIGEVRASRQRAMILNSLQGIPR